MLYVLGYGFLARTVRVAAGLTRSKISRRVAAGKQVHAPVANDRVARGQEMRPK